MKKVIKRAAMLICIALVSIISMKTGVVVKASSAGITITTTKKEVQIGDTFTALVSVDSTDIIGGFEGYIEYDEDLLEFVTGGSYVSGGSGLLRISDLDSEEQNESKKYGLQFKAKKKGKSLIEISDTPMVYNADGEELSVSSNQLEVSVINSKKLSKNCKLSKLLISPGTLNQEYSNDISAYKTSIPYENDMLFVSAVPEDSDAVVELEGNDNLQVGKNFVHVIITAPSGKTKDIQIEVTRLGEGESIGDETSETEEENAIEVSNTTKVVEDEFSVLLVSNHQFTVVDLEDENEIPQGYEKSTINIDSKEIPAYISTDMSQSEFVLLYLKNNLGEKSFYQYDRVEKTIQRYVESNKITQNPVIEDDGITPKNDKAMTSSVIAIAVLAGICIILSIVIIAIILKHKKEENEETY